MRAVLLSFGEAAEPAPQADEVLIDVHAASVSYMDYLMICGGLQARSPLRAGNGCRRDRCRLR
jgi:NADPH:quinone reductase-like Zn-dependent oxidoreductase